MAQRTVADGNENKGQLKLMQKNRWRIALDTTQTRTGLAKKKATAIFDFVTMYASKWFYTANV